MELQHHGSIGMLRASGTYDDSIVLTFEDSGYIEVGQP